MSDHLAKEADRLKNDDIFQKALADIRSEALEALANADAEDLIEILRLQQRVQVIDELRDMLGRYIMAARQPQEENSPFA